ncbi:MAG: hypothetical protein VBE63_16255 [Lamprobacter sp.]|nr:hypothetical protein [Lamprobacter sp.]
MLDTQILGQCLLELLVEGAAVGEDLVVPDLLQVGDKLLERGQVGLGDVDSFVGTHRKERLGVQSLGDVMFSRQVTVYGGGCCSA